jgi:hypothetical protein
MARSHGFLEMTDQALVDHVAESTNPIEVQTPALAEMQRRLLVAIRDFNMKSGRQATVMIWLTILIAALTVAILILTGVMVWKG